MCLLHYRCVLQRIAMCFVSQCSTAPCSAKMRLKEIQFRSLTLFWGAITKIKMKYTCIFLLESEQAEPVPNMYQLLGK